MKYFISMVTGARSAILEADGHAHAVERYTGLRTEAMIPVLRGEVLYVTDGSCWKFAHIERRHEEHALIELFARLAKSCPELGLLDD